MAGGAFNTFPLGGGNSLLFGSLLTFIGYKPNSIPRDHINSWLAGSLSFISTDGAAVLMDEVMSSFVVIRDGAGAG